MHKVKRERVNGSSAKNTICLLAQRPLARYLDGYFDDNKPYLVMYLTILFKRFSG